MRSWASSYCSARTRIFQSPRPPWFFAHEVKRGGHWPHLGSLKIFFVVLISRLKKSIDVNKPQLEVFTKLKYRIVIIYIIIAFLRVNCETLNGKFWRSNPYKLLDIMLTDNYVKINIILSIYDIIYVLQVMIQLVLNFI